MEPVRGLLLFYFQELRPFKCETGNFESLFLKICVQWLSSKLKLYLLNTICGSPSGSLMLIPFLQRNWVVTAVNNHVESKLIEN